MDFMLSSYMAMTNIIPIPRNMPQAWKTKWKKGFSPDLVSTDIISGNWKRRTKKKLRKHLFPYSCFAIKLEPGVICTVYYQERERERERERLCVQIHACDGFYSFHEALF